MVKNGMGLGVSVNPPEDSGVEGAMEHKVIAITIEENGDLTFLNTDASDAFLEIGQVVTRRASHVEPANLGYRVVFHILRWFGDKNQIAEWTRHWPVVWRVNTKPVGGPILKWSDVDNWNSCDCPDGIAVWLDRQEAIDAEIKFLNNWFAVR